MGLFIVLFVGIFTIGEFVFFVIMVQLYNKVNYWTQPADSKLRD